MGRAIDICEACGEEKEIVSRGLCHNCNMRREREEKAALRGEADKHSSAQRKAQERLDAGLVKMMKLLNDFEASGLVAVEDISAVRLAIKPYVDRIGDSLEPQEDREARERLDAALRDARSDVQAVMGMQYPAKPFTGALSQPETESPGDAPGEQLNTEHPNASEPVHTDGYKLPPVIGQYRKPVKKENKSTNGKPEGHAAKA
jgi:hypothetical protein